MAPRAQSSRTRTACRVKQREVFVGSGEASHNSPSHPVAFTNTVPPVKRAPLRTAVRLPKAGSASQPFLAGVNKLLDIWVCASSSDAAPATRH